MSTAIVPTTDELNAIRRDRYRKAAECIQRWSKETADYDEQVGEVLTDELNDAAFRCEDTDEPRS